VTAVPATGSLVVCVNDAQVCEMPGPRKSECEELRGACCFGGHKVRLAVGDRSAPFRLPKKKRADSDASLRTSRGDLAQLASEQSGSRASSAAGSEERVRLPARRDEGPPMFKLDVRRSHGS
jgi:hypothetical protein